MSLPQLLHQGINLIVLEFFSVILRERVHQLVVLWVVFWNTHILTHPSRQKTLQTQLGMVPRNQEQLQLEAPIPQRGSAKTTSLNCSSGHNQHAFQGNKNKLSFRVFGSRWYHVWSKLLIQPQKTSILGERNCGNGEINPIYREFIGFFGSHRRLGNLCSAVHSDSPFGLNPRLGTESRTDIHSQMSRTSLPMTLHHDPEALARPYRTPTAISYNQGHQRRALIDRCHFFLARLTHFVGFPTFLMGNREISKVNFQELEVNSQGLEHSDEKAAN
jgi:hypothetical protein